MKSRILTFIRKIFKKENKNNHNLATHAHQTPNASIGIGTFDQLPNDTIKDILKFITNPHDIKSIVKTNKKLHELGKKAQVNYKEYNPDLSIYEKNSCTYIGLLSKFKENQLKHDEIFKLVNSSLYLKSEEKLEREDIAKRAAVGVASGTVTFLSLAFIPGVNLFAPIAAGLASGTGFFVSLCVMKDPSDRKEALHSKIEKLKAEVKRYQI